MITSPSADGDPGVGVLWSSMLPGRAPTWRRSYRRQDRQAQGAGQLRAAPLRPGFSGREPFDWPARLLENRQRLLDQAAEPYVGITTDGTVLPGLYDIQPTGVSTRPLLDAANALARRAHPRAARHRQLRPRERRVAHLEQHLAVPGAPRPPPGRSLGGAARARAGPAARHASAAGYQTARDVMRLNHTIAELTGGWDELRRVDVLAQPVRHAVRRPSRGAGRSTAIT